jgi:hypothetical protein
MSESERAHTGDTLMRLIRERDEARAQRDALAAILAAVPVAAHNAAVLASGVNLLTYTAAMEAATDAR